MNRVPCHWLRLIKHQLEIDQRANGTLVCAQHAYCAYELCECKMNMETKGRSNFTHKMTQVCRISRMSCAFDVRLGRFRILNLCKPSVATYCSTTERLLDLESTKSSLNVFPPRFLALGKVLFSRSGRMAVRSNEASILRVNAVHEKIGLKIGIWFHHKIRHCFTQRDIFQNRTRVKDLDKKPGVS
jgi:hypothetical protein